MALKLSDSDKKAIVELYQHPEESTATLASRYAVSSSTISRILRQELSPEEYQQIVQQKKGGGSKPQSRKPSSVSSSPKTVDKVSDQVTLKSGDDSEIAKPVKKKSIRSKPSRSKPDRSKSDRSKSDESKGSTRGRTRSRSSAKPKVSASPDVETASQDAIEDQLPLPLTESTEIVDAGLEDDTPIVVADIDANPDATSDELVHEIQADLLQTEDFHDDELDDDLDEEDLDEEDLDDEDDLEVDLDSALELPLDGDQLCILPFSEAKLPKTCYVVIDRSAELITRPLKTFADLGTVPDEEINEPTLPIFDNHRVAKRFANRRTQRIVKVPDAGVLRKTSIYLMDKGITRLLLDGQVYALLDEDDFEPFDE